MMTNKDDIELLAAAAGFYREIITDIANQKEIAANASRFWMETWI